MDKLIELLNEYEEKYNRSDLYYKFELENGQLFCYDDVTDTLWTMQDEAIVICSKKFGFIKWLVDNDKIEWSEKTAFVTFLEREINADKSDALISLLSIKDNPIEFLISILK